MQFERAPFGQLFACPQKNGLTRPKKVRGTGLPMVNMGELFAYPRIGNLKMDLVPVSSGEDGFLLAPGDLLFARQSLVRDGAGQCSIFTGNALPTVFESHLIRCRLAKNRAVPDFYFYFFRSPQGRIAIDAIIEQGAGAAGIRGSDLVRVQVPVPPLSHQRWVVDLLRSIDDRIDLLRQTNATLESIAQALFKSWFIDFDPVRTKAEGGEPEGMDAATAALFPAEFEESALGLIPKGWRAGRFGDMAELAKGSVNPLAAPDKDFEHYSLPAFDAGQLPILERGETIKSNKTRVPAGAVLQSKLNPHIPRVWLPSRIGDQAVCSTEFLPWVARRPASGELIYCILTSSSFEASVRTLVTGTSNSHQRVKPDQVAELELVVAPGTIAEAFAQAVSPLLCKVGENRLLAKGLAELRDTLLPRLISGKLRLPEAQAQLEEAMA